MPFTWIWGYAARAVTGGAASGSHAGECTRSAPVSEQERTAVLGIAACSLDLGAGHVLTQRDHVCGEFRDQFDWSSLPPAYLRRIGQPKRGPGGG